MTQKLYEKFSWIKQDLIYAGPKGNKAQFKGVALLPTISGNGKKYVTEELHRSARTLVGKPLTLNHNPNKVLGDVTWAEFENDCIEYVAETKNPEYIAKLQDRKRLTKEAYVKKWGRDPIYGVSVEANYRFHDSQCVGGHCTLEPHGIIFNALSLVEDPERPGVTGTTVEIMETLNVEKRLSEMIVKDLVPPEHQSSVLTESKTKVTTMTNPKEKIEEECSCPPGQHKNENGECVPNSEDTAEEMLEIKHQIEKSELKRAKETKAITENLAKTKTELANKIVEIDTAQKTCCNRLGETQKTLLDTEAIAKGSLEKVQALETLKETWALKTDVDLKADAAAVESLKEAMDASSKNVQETLAQTITKTELKEQFAKLPSIQEAIKPLQEQLNSIPKPEETINPLIEKINTRLTAVETENKNLKETIDAQQTKLEESDKKYGTLNTVYTALNEKYEGFVKETEEKKLRETQETDAKTKTLQETVDNLQREVQERKDEIETLKLHVKPSFKAKVDVAQKDNTPVYASAY